MSDIPGGLKYTREHEWIRDEGDGTVVVGITDHAQVSLGDLVFVELPELESHLGAGDSCAVVESVKAASDVYSPLTGTVVAVNDALSESPERVNEDPYGDGWLFRLRPESPDELEALMSNENYQQFLAELED